MSAASMNKDHLTLISSDAKTSIVNVDKDIVIAANEDNTHMKMIIEKNEAKALKPASPLNSKTTDFLKPLIPAIFGVLLFLGIWTLLAHQQPILPGPISTWHSAVELFSHPFHRNSLDDQGDRKSVV